MNDNHDAGHADNPDWVAKLQVARHTDQCQVEAQYTIMRQTSCVECPLFSHLQLRIPWVDTDVAFLKAMEVHLLIKEK